MGTEAEPRAVPAKSVVSTLVFVIVIQLAALGITYYVAPVTSEVGYTYAPAGTSALGSATSAIVLVAGAFVSTFIAVWLIRRKRADIFTWVITIATGLALFLMTLLTVATIAAYFVNTNADIFLSVAAAAVATAALALVTRVPRYFVAAPIVTGLLSAEVGGIFASTIPLLTALVLAAVFSVYDIYAVFRGPLKQLVTIAPTKALGVVTSRVGEFTLGTGDTIFYSMLPALAFIQPLGAAAGSGFDLLGALGTMAAIDLGVVVTLILLSRSKMLPGLPIPMALGLVVVLALILL